VLGSGIEGWRNRGQRGRCESVGGSVDGDDMGRTGGHRYERDVGVGREKKSCAWVMRIGQVARIMSQYSPEAQKWRNIEKGQQV
jgi:hypothetical protein